MCPFFCDFARDIDQALTDPDKALDELTARNPEFVQASIFRAILRLPEDQIENMGYDEFIDNTIMLKEILKLMHLPYISKEQVNTSING